MMSPRARVVWGADTVACENHHISALLPQLSVQIEELRSQHLITAEMAGDSGVMINCAPDFSASGQ